MEFRNKARSRREQRKSSRIGRFFRRLRKSQSGLQLVEMLVIMAIVVVTAIIVLTCFFKPVRYRVEWVGDVVLKGLKTANANLKDKTNDKDEPPAVFIDQDNPD